MNKKNKNGNCNEIKFENIQYDSMKIEALISATTLLERVAILKERKGKLIKDELLNKIVHKIETVIDGL